ncbi:MAG: hypothetical protein LVR00_04725 [Rhabdochlamydiaceae bacterium]|jgi:putative peptidoglycan lipid II flippase
MDQPKSIVRSAMHFFSGTFLSRVTGFLREIAIASCFGAGVGIANFFLAQRFSILMRRLFGEGSLLAGFSPNFEAARAVSAKEGAAFFGISQPRLVFVLLRSLLLQKVGCLFFYAMWHWLKRQERSCI